METISDQSSGILDDFLAGTSSANMTLFNLCLSASSRDNVTVAINTRLANSAAAAREQLHKLLELWEDSPQAFDTVATGMQTFYQALHSGNPDDHIGQLAHAYDAFAKLNPSASVALYALGRDDILSNATAEICDYLLKAGLLGKDQTALEIGCGIGRISEAIAPHLRTLTGIDISSKMIELAALRCAKQTNVKIFQTNGRDFGHQKAQSVDLVLAVDSFPYIVEAGTHIVTQNFGEICRVLKPNGRLVIFNYSHRTDDLDHADISAFAAENGFSILRNGDRSFHYWDGTTYDLQRN